MFIAIQICVDGACNGLISLAFRIDSLFGLLVFWKSQNISENHSVGKDSHNLNCQHHQVLPRRFVHVKSLYHLIQ